MLGDLRQRQRFQPAIVVELVQAHVAQLQPLLGAVVVLLATLRIEDDVALACPHAGVLGDDQVVRTGRRLECLGATLAPGAERFAIDHHQQRQHRERRGHGDGQASARQADRAQGSQFRGRRELAQGHQRTDHRGGREQGVGPARCGIGHVGERFADAVAAVAHVAEFGDQSQHQVQPEQHRPGQQHRADDHPAEVEVVDFRERHHGAATLAGLARRGRRIRPSVKYSQNAIASNGSTSHHSPSTGARRPVSSQSVPTWTMFMPTR